MASDHHVEVAQSHDGFATLARVDPLHTRCDNAGP